jgi:hypothetical protein
MNQKLDAIADGLADLMEHVSPDDDDLQGDRRKLRQAVGAERAD